MKDSKNVQSLITVPLFDSSIDLSNAPPIKIAECFVEEFKVSEKLDLYNTWVLTDKARLENEIAKLVSALSGNLKRETRTKKTLKRNGLIKSLKEYDPRRIETKDYTEFIIQHNLAKKSASTADLAVARTYLTNSLEQAVSNTDEYTMTGLIPFLPDFEGSNVCLKVKSIDDYTRDAMTDHGRKTTVTLQGKKRTITRNLELMEIYSEVPADIKIMANIYIEHSLEFSIRVAKLQDEMLKNTLLVFNAGANKLKAIGA